MNFPFSDVISDLVRELDGKAFIAWRHFSSGFIFYHNEHESFHAASVIKVPILIELCRQIESGKVDFDEIYNLQTEDIVDGAGVLQELHHGIPLTIHDLAVLMTVISDNTASNIIIDRLGFDSINQLISFVGMKNTRLNKKFMTPLASPQLFNRTTAYDMALVMEKLWRGTLLGPKLTKEVIDILSRQQYREKIPKYIPHEVKIANKTGEVSGVRHDCSIVLIPGSEYSLSVCTSELKDEWAGDEFIALVSKEIYKFAVSL